MPPELTRATTRTKPLRALLRKDWRALRMIRLGGYAVAILLPIALSLVDQQGHDLGKILIDVQPLAIWPVFCLLLALQAFGADRTGGTDLLLLTQPVPRRTIWLGRLLGTVLSLLAIVALSAGFAALWAYVGGEPVRWWPFARAADPIKTVAYAALASACGLVGGMIAAALLRPALAAVVVALVLGGVPLLAAILVEDGAFEYARVGWFHAGLTPLVWFHAGLMPLVVLVGYPVISYVVTCRGEPLAPRRELRALRWLGALFALVLVAFPVSAEIVLRHNADRPTWILAASRNGHTAVVGLHDRRDVGLWIVDGRTGDRRAFLPPPVLHAVCSADGRRIAIVTKAGSFGSRAEAERIEVYDDRGECLLSYDLLGSLRALNLPRKIYRAFVRETHVRDLAFAGDVLVAVIGTSRRTGALGLLLHPETGVRVLELPPIGPYDFVTIDLVSDRQGTVYATIHRHWSKRDGLPFAVYRVDVERGRLSETPLFKRDQAASSLQDMLSRRRSEALRTLTLRGPLIVRPEETLSPTGRFLAQLQGLSDSGGGIVWSVLDADGRSVRSVDVGSGVSWPCWLAGDRLVFAESDGRRTALKVIDLAGDPGAAPRNLRRWPGSELRFTPSPDGTRLLVWPGTPGELAIYDPEKDSVRILKIPPSAAVTWLGASRLACMRPARSAWPHDAQALSVVDLDEDPATLRPFSP